MNWCLVLVVYLKRVGTFHYKHGILTAVGSCITGKIM